MWSLNHLRRWGSQSVLAQSVSKGILQFGDLRHHGERVLRLLVHFGLEFLILLAYTLDLLPKFCKLLGALAAGSSLALHPRLFAFVVFGRWDRFGRRCHPFHVGVDPSQMLIQIFLARKAFPSVPLAVRVRTVDSVLGPSMLAMDLAFVSE